MKYCIVCHLEVKGGEIVCPQCGSKSFQHFLPFKWKETYEVLSSRVEESDSFFGTAQVN